MHDTALTRAARNSVDNADVITAGVSGYRRDFKPKKAAKRQLHTEKAKSRKSERKTVKKP